MNERKLREKYRAEHLSSSVPIKAARFDLYALGTRTPMARVMADERAYWSDENERVLGMVFRDTTDGDYCWMLLVRDKIGRFRCVDVRTEYQRFAEASDGVRERIKRAIEENDFVALGHQGDETNHPIDVLSLPPGTRDEDLHPHFRTLIISPSRHPSRSVFREIAPWLAPSDPDFVSEFQFKHFDQRLWEMYLWAALRELQYEVSQPNAPDFLCNGLYETLTVEATTVSPSTSGVLAEHPDPQTPEEMEEFLAHYMPMKFGSSLTSKLNKKDKDGKPYWERGAAASKPFLIAVADFHITGSGDKPGSMTYTQSALWPYLYGHRVKWEFINGQLVTRAVRGAGHTYKGKFIETGFFDLPGAENISAVLFSNAGTLAKFDRMGIAAGFIPADHKYYRFGLRFDPDPNAVRPVPFSEEIGHPNYIEKWSDELQIFHNPRAKRPLSIEAFRGITQHYFKDGKQYSLTPEGTVLGSRTLIVELLKEGKREATV